MTNRSRSVAAVLGLAAILCPSAVVLAILGHDLDRPHARPAHHHDDEIAIALHGHHHDPGTPTHEHVQVVAKAARIATRLGPVPMMAAPFQSSPDSPTPATIVAGAVAGPSHGPPNPPPTFTVLRI